MKPRLPWTPHRTRVLVPVIGLVMALLAVGAWALGSGPASLVDTSAASASVGCSVSYTVDNQWNTGFTMGITITNYGAGVHSWTLGYSYADGQQLTAGWDGDWTQQGSQVTVTSVSWNGNLTTGGGWTKIGANFSYRGDNAAPTAFTLNGVACNGGRTPSPSAAPSSASPTASASPTPQPSSASPSPTPSSPPPSSPGPAGSAPQLQVSGNELVSSGGQQVVLHGVDRPGFEYACVQGWGFYDGPVDQASVTAMKSVGVNAVRIPLNEACWNAESYVKPAFAGAAYQAAIKAYVSLLNANGIVAILDLHWSDGTYTGNAAGCASEQATCQKPMPDSAQAVPFWSSVAQTFKGNDAVVFDLFNEPYPEQADNNNDAEGWQCWRNGGSCAGIGYPVAGMQTLVSTVRGTGANNVIMLGGLEWSDDLDGWLAHEPTDPDHDLAASWHSYSFNACNNESCWNSQVAPVIAQVPVITGEMGETDCADDYIDPLMTWLDAQKTSYLAWSWNTVESCSSGPGLITNYDGAPNSYGAGFEAHLKSLGG
jgi:endoglucanase